MTIALPDLSGQAAREVDAGLRRALAAMGHAQRAAALGFAEILARRLYRELGYSSIHHYATAALGFSPGRTAHYLHLAEALNRLPLLRAAVCAGEIGWTKAVVVAAIATGRTEAVWLAEAQRLGRPELARRAAQARAQAREAAAAGTLELSARPVALPPCPPYPAPPPPPAAAPGTTAAPGGPAPSALPTPTRALTAGTPPLPADGAGPALPDVPLHVSFRFTAAQYARYAAQVERLRRRAGAGGRGLPAGASREELILAALDALLRAAQAGGDAAAAPLSAAPPYQIFLYRCETCGGGRVKTPLGERPLPAAALAAAACDARVFAPGGRNEATVPPAVRRAVLVRDGHCCRAPGCGRTRFLEVHHRVPRARGGSNGADNLITLCAACHRLRHEHEASGRPEVSARASP